MRRLFALLVPMLCAVAAAVGAEPDFAYPQTVIKDAEAHLKDSRSGVETLRALMEIATAKTAIDRDSLGAVTSLVHDYASREKDPTARTLMLLYAAEINGSDSAAAACANVALTLPRTPISQYARVIEADADARLLFPTVADFVLYKAYTLADDADSKERIASMAADAMGHDSLPGMWWWTKTCTASELLAFIAAHPRGEATAWAIRQIYDYPEDAVSDDTKIDLTRRYLAENPANFLTPGLENLLSQLTQPVMTVTYPSTATPGTAVAVVCRHKFCKTFGVEIYRATDAPGRRTVKVTDRIERPCEPTSAFVTDTIYFTPTSAGYYGMRAVADGTATSATNCDMSVSPIFPFVIENYGKFAAFVADFATGRGVEGATFDICTPINQKYPTDAMGVARFEIDRAKNARNGSYTWRLKYHGQEFLPNSPGFYVRTTPRPYEGTVCRIMPDRPLYHPGDSLMWSLVACDASGGKPLGATTMTVTLRDANYQTVASDTIATSPEGRAAGSFAIPADRLAGRYTLTAIIDGNHCCSQSVTVSDFKMAAFEILGLKARCTADSVSVAGRVITYTSAAVGGARVDITFSRTRARYISPSSYATDASLTITATTASDGSFTVSIPKTDLEADRYYQISVTATSLTSETASATTSVQVGMPVVLTSAIGEMLSLDSSDRLGVTASATEASYLPVKARWDLLRTDGSVAASGECLIDSTGTSIPELCAMAADTYRLRFTPADTAVCAPLTTNDFGTYSLKHNTIAPAARLFFPPQSTRLSSDATLIVGVGQEATVMVVATSETDILEARTYSLKPGFTHISLPANASAESLTVIAATWNGSGFDTREITYTAPDPDEVKMEVETFRDRLTPGAKERITLRLSRTDGTPVGGSLVATMYNHALDALAPYGMPSLADRSLIGASMASYLSPRMAFVPRSYENRSESEFRYFGTGSLSFPEFKYLPVAKYQSYVFGSRMYMAASPAMANGAVMEKSMATADLSAEVTMEDAADTGGASDQTESDADYRDTDVMQALWMPLLSFDADGGASISFDAPNALGAWTFRAWGWSTDMHAATLVRRCVTSKPLMVQAALPRYLRAGDSARVMATVYNTESTPQDVACTVETFSIADGHTISTCATTLHISAAASDTIGIDIHAPAGLEAIGYRVRCTAGTFTDGEQASITILPSDATVTHSDLFYLTDENPTYTTTLPSAGITAVQVCTDPVWEAVKGLPSMYTLKPETAPAAANTLFGAFLATGLSESVPQIRRVLKTWNTTDTAALTSRLQKNQDLRLTQLQQTPWMQTAISDTERMQRIATVFDPKTIAEMNQKAVSTLTRLQRPDGGMAWGAWSNQSSGWVTATVLRTLGKASNLGYLPADKTIDGIIDRAMAYLDATVASKGTDMAYTALYAMYPDRKPTTLAGRNMISRTTQMILKDWKKMSTSEKARAALTLHRLGHKASAREIIGSIRQFEVKSPMAGISFPSVNDIDTYATILEAFAAIDPQTAEIDAMRQWLLVRTQSTMQMAAYDPASLIAALLTTGSAPSIGDATVELLVDGTPLNIPDAEAATGYVSARVQAHGTPFSAHYTGPTGGVAYGSVTSISTRQMAGTPAYASEAIAIEKRLMVNRSGRWVETTAPALGERVRVELRIEAKRDMQFVTVTDERPAAFEPVLQMPGYEYTGALGYYRVNGDSRTCLYINHMPKGTYTLSYEMTAALRGTFSSGIATAQSALAPELTAHSGGMRMTVK